MRLIPEDDDMEDVEFNIDGMYSAVSTFYPFIPVSQIEIRRFWVQISLIVNNMNGPFNPPEVTERQFIGKNFFIEVFY